MKTTSFLLTVALLVGCAGCNVFTKKEPVTAISVVGDITDEGLNEEAPENIYNLYHVSQDALYQGSIFRIRTISPSDRDIYEYQVKPVDNWLEGNANLRVAEWRVFKKNVNKAIGDLEAEDIKECSVSPVYENLCKEGAALMETKSDHKILICMSDLMQHTESINMYDERVLAQARRNPDAVVAQFKKIAPMPNLQGVSVYFLHHSKTRKQQIQYDCAVSIFARLVKDAGAEHVYIEPNLVANE